MSPSLFNLFKRGRYCRSSIHEDSDGEAKATRTELERFVMAALAFAIKHDPDGVGLHFLNSVCGARGKPAVKSIIGVDCQIEVDDLDLVLSNRTDRWVHVVEAKVKAKLAAHQRPDKDDFFEADQGYGRKATANFPWATEFAYTTLGAREVINAKDRNNWRFEQKSWGDFHQDFPSTLMAKELEDFLARTGIHPFTMLKTKGVIMAPKDVEVAATAFTVLMNVVEALRLRARDHSPDIEWQSGSDWHFGFQVNHSAGDGPLAALAKVVAADDALAWYGYQGPTDAKAAVWLYVSEATAGPLAEKLKAEGFNSGLEHGCVVVKRDGGASGGSEQDAAWFRSVFVAAAKI